MDERDPRRLPARTVPRFRSRCGGAWRACRAAPLYQKSLPMRRLHHGLNIGNSQAQFPSGYGIYPAGTLAKLNPLMNTLRRAYAGYRLEQRAFSGTKEIGEA